MQPRQNHSDAHHNKKKEIKHLEEREKKHLALLKQGTAVELKLIVFSNPENVYETANLFRAPISFYHSSFQNPFFYYYITTFSKY